MTPIRTVIMGAAGRDFHNFNVYFRDNPDYEVIGFTATQIPNIEGRVYPPGLAGSHYPDGIPIYAENELKKLIKDQSIDQVIFAYSDVPHEYVMHNASLVLSAGADFRLMGLATTQIKSSKPVVAVCAVRTGSGKSQTSRLVSMVLRDLGFRVAAIRHPMPYGDLVAQAVQRFAEYEDLDIQDCTIEEREEYEPHLENGIVVYAGVDYERILREAEKEADIPRGVSSFVLPLGATVNMNGTALYECAAAIFIAQAYGFELTFAMQFSIVSIALLTSIGVAGVPSALSW